MVSEVLTKKHYLIIKYLSDKDACLTSAEMAQKIGMSTRTVKRYINDINYELKKMGVEIIALKGIGYKLTGTPKVLQGVLKEALRVIDGFEIDDSIEGRVENAINLLINNDTLNADEMAEKLNLSTSSFNKMTSKIKECIKKYNLTIASKPHYGTYIDGEELNIRALILDYCIKADNNNNLKVYLSNVNKEDIETIEKIISIYLKENNIVVADKDFNNLLSRIIVSLSRMRKNKTVENLSLINNYRHHNYSAIHSIMSQVEKALDVAFSETEYYYVSFYSGFMIYNYSMRNLQDTDLLDEEIFSFVKALLEEIKIITGNEFDQDTKLIKAMTIHIKIAINRARAGAQVKNPLLQQIKSNYPVEMNFAMFAAKKIYDYYGIELDEDEVGFIAMHFGAAQERIKTNMTKKICIVCQYGIGTAQLLSEKIKNHIKYVEVIGVYPARYLDVALKQNVDYIVSTVEIEDYKSNIPIISVDNVLSDSSIKKIGDIITLDISKKKLLFEMFNRKAFYRLKASTKEEVINLMGSMMEKEGLIDSNVVKSILERENMSSTDIGNLVAIPHTAINGVHKSVIGVAILDKPILWDVDEVQIIFMICFNLADRKNLHIFKNIYSLIDDIDFIKSMIKSKDFDEFIQLLSEGR